MANGYDPHPTGRLYAWSHEPIRTLELRKCDGRSAYLLLDGNHRVATLSALGETTVSVTQVATDIVHEADCEQWYGVKAGVYDPSDALHIFNAYFNGNHRYYTSDEPTRIIGPPQWSQMYLPPQLEDMASCVVQP